MAQHCAYLEQLRAVPAFARCSHRALVRIGQLVDRVDVPTGTALAVGDHDVVIAMAPTRVLIVDRRALPAVLELAPEILDVPTPRRPQTSMVAASRPLRTAAASAAWSAST